MEERLTVAVFLKVTGLLLVVNDGDFLSSADLLQGGFDLGAFDVWGADSGILTVIHKQNLIKGEFVTLFIITGDFLNLDGITHGDFVLLSSCFYNCKFHG